MLDFEFFKSNIGRNVKKFGTVIYSESNRNCEFCEASVSSKKSNNNLFDVCTNPILSWLYEPRHNWVLRCPVDHHDCSARNKIFEVGDINRVKQIVKHSVMRGGYIAFTKRQWRLLLNYFEYVKVANEKHLTSKDQQIRYGKERYLIWLFRYVGFRQINNKIFHKKFFVVLQRGALYDDELYKSVEVK